MFWLSIRTQPLWWKNRLQLLAASRERSRIAPCIEKIRHGKVTLHDAQRDIAVKCKGRSLTKDCLMDTADLRTVQEFKEFPNGPKGLLGVMVPAAVSLALCPVTLYLYRPLMKLFWPPDGIPLGDDADEVVNSIVYSFLIPSGLIYATTFGFAFQEVANKRGLLGHQLSSFRELVRMVCTQVVHNSDLSVQAKCTLMRCLTSHVLIYMQKLTGSENKDKSFDGEPCVVQFQNAPLPINTQLHRNLGDHEVKYTCHSTSDHPKPLLLRVEIRPFFILLSYNLSWQSLTDRYNSVDGKACHVQAGISTFV